MFLQQVKKMQPTEAIISTNKTTVFIVKTRKFNKNISKANLQDQLKD